jgi:hypothetical protein
MKSNMKLMPAMLFGGALVLAGTVNNAGAAVILSPVPA